jgi:hypothetical protein
MLLLKKSLSLHNKMIFTDEDGMTAALCIIIIPGAIRRRGIRNVHCVVVNI